VRNGFGRLRLADGRTFIGEWRGDKIEGNQQNIDKEDI
jgi:hypothetical protein